MKHLYTVAALIAIGVSSLASFKVGQISQDHRVAYLEGRLSMYDHILDGATYNLAAGQIYSKIEKTDLRRGGK